jgi:hypothetical protein
MSTGPVILRRTITVMHDQSGQMLARANVWTAKGYSSRTFKTAAEAAAWTPRK